MTPRNCWLTCTQDNLLCISYTSLFLKREKSKRLFFSQELYRLGFWLNLLFCKLGKTQTEFKSIDLEEIQNLIPSRTDGGSNVINCRYSQVLLTDRCKRDITKIKTMKSTNKILSLNFQVQVPNSWAYIFSGGFAIPVMLVLHKSPSGLGQIFSC